MKKIFVFLNDFGLLILVALFVGLFLLAVIGNMDYVWVDWQLLLSSILSVATADAKDAPPLVKSIHVLLAIIFSWTIVKIYLTTIGYRWDDFLARYWVRRHVVIVAGQADEVASYCNFKDLNVEHIDSKLPFAFDLAFALASRYKVVLSIPTVENNHLENLWRAGVIVVRGKGGVIDMLQRVGIQRASMLIAMRDVYSDNVVMIRTALSYKERKQPLVCKCMIEPMLVKQWFRIEDYVEEKYLSQIRIFNEAEIIARRIVASNPPDHAVATTSHRVHVLLVGLGAVGQAIVLQLARIGHYKSGSRPKVTAIDKDVNARWAQLTKAYPALSDWVELEPIENYIEDLSPADVRRWLHDVHPVTMVYVCTKNEITNLRIARMIVKDLSDSGRADALDAKVVVLDPPGGCILQDFAKDIENKDKLIVFSLAKLDKAKKQSIAVDLLVEADEHVAKELHADYFSKCSSSPIDAKKAACKPWELLEETYRIANRAAADHFDVKLRAIGRDVISEKTGYYAPLTEIEMEVLAEMEHRRWWADRALDGWKYGLERNDPLKIHPDMLPFKELADAVKQRDRDSVNKIFEIKSRCEMS